ncbi:MAG: hypothetical protein R2706_16930 [Acidimicrobiales bacterium]
MRVPKMAGAGWSFQKFNRRAQDWAIVGVAAVANGSTSVALINMGQTPMRAVAVEAALRSGALGGRRCGSSGRRHEPPEQFLMATPTTGHTLLGSLSSGVG